MGTQFNISLEEKKNSFVMRSCLKGFSIPAGENGSQEEIKAAAYHNIAIIKDAGCWRVDIIFDV